MAPRDPPRQGFDFAALVFGAGVCDAGKFSARSERMSITVVNAVPIWCCRSKPGQGDEPDHPDAALGGEKPCAGVIGAVAACASAAGRTQMNVVWGRPGVVEAVVPIPFDLGGDQATEDRTRLDDRPHPRRCRT